VSEDLSNQFPKPPKLQPLAAGQTKTWQFVSFALIMVGVVLLATGGWKFYQQQVEASKPPPARILEVSIVDPTATPLPSPSPTKLKRTATAQAATDTPTPEPTATLTVVVEPDERAGTTPTVKLAPTLTDTPTPTTPPTRPASPTPTAEPTSETAAEVPSLADNPLVVEEAAVAASSEPGATAAVSGPTRLAAESIGLDASVVEVGWEQVVQDGVTTNVWVVADYAAGWHQNSSLPGQGGNIVLSGHHNIKGEVFRHIVDIELNEVITLYLGDQPYQFVVQDKFIVQDKGEPEAIRRENAKWIGPFNEERLTLVTCWPYNSNTHRVIVIAKPMPSGG